MDTCLFRVCPLWKLVKQCIVKMLKQLVIRCSYQTVIADVFKLFTWNLGVTLNIDWVFFCESSFVTNSKANCVQFGICSSYSIVTGKSAGMGCFCLWARYHFEYWVRLHYSPFSEKWSGWGMQLCNTYSTDLAPEVPQVLTRCWALPYIHELGVVNPHLLLK